jgi:hypothetical protein
MLLIYVELYNYTTTITHQVLDTNLRFVGLTVIMIQMTDVQFQSNAVVLQNLKVIVSIDRFNATRTVKSRKSKSTEMYIRKII